MAVACRLRLGVTALVMEKDDLWSFCNCGCGQLRLGMEADQLLLACVVRADKVFDGDVFVMVTAGEQHTACVTVRGRPQRCVPSVKEKSASWGTVTGIQGNEQHG